MKKVDTNLNDLIQNLTKMNVEVSIGEPWNFGEGKERNPFEAIIEQVLITIHSMGNKIIVKESVLLRIRQPFPYNNLKCEFLLASPRHEGIGLRNFINGNLVSFNFLRIPKDDACSDNPFMRENSTLNDKYYGLIGSIQKNK